MPKRQESNAKKMNNSNDPPLCSATGCGLYGNAAQQNMCSIYFKDILKIAALKQLEELPRASPNTNNNNAVKVRGESGGEVKTIMKKNKCGSCKKRVRLTIFECKCGEVYCGSHRYPEMHSCLFDFKGVQREGLSKILYSAAECQADKLRHCVV